MRFLRLFVYCAIAAGSIYAWETFRDDLIKLSLDIIKHETTAEASQTTSETVAPPASEKTEALTATENSPTAENKPQVEETVSVPVGLSFEKGFAEIAQRMMHSVVNVATMQVIKPEATEDVFDDFFEGSPFSDLFKDFFGKQMPKEKKERRATALGSGFIVKVDKAANKAYVVTNYHVIDKAKKVVLYLSDKTELSAEIHAVDQRTDIAVLVVDTKILGDKVDLLVPIKWGDSDALEEGNWVIAIGNPFNLGCTVTNGIVSAKARHLPLSVAGSNSLSLVEDFIQHSAPINSGNSGGCLLNVKGEVVGVNNVILSPPSGGFIGISFAIPANIVKNTVEQLIEHKRTYRGWIGIEVHNVLAKQAESVGIDVGNNLNPAKVFGSFVGKVTPNGPAEKAGIKRGDIIIEFNGQKISDKGGLSKIVGNTKINSKVPVKVWRLKEGGAGWHEVTLEATVGDFEEALKKGITDKSKTKEVNQENPKEEEVPELGITISAIPSKMKSTVPEEFKNNLLVTKIDENFGNSVFFFGPIFLPGDIIISANDVKVTSVEQFKKIIEGLKKKNIGQKPVPFVIVRDGAMMMLATTIDFSKTKK